MKKKLVLPVLLVFVLLFSAMTPDVNRRNIIKAPDGYTFVPMGSLKIDTSTVTVQAFFISKTEISNKQYREFLADLKASGDMNAYNKALPDTTQWRDRQAYNEPFVEYYFRHPAYDNYPVVNISYEGAQMYCKWLTEKMAKVCKNLKADFRLPTREEWIYAASGGMTMTDYSFGGPYLGDKNGNMQCNFKRIGAESVHYNESTKQYEVVKDIHDGKAGCINDAADITAPVESYKPNDFGLYNMSGNVAEMVWEKGTAVGGSWNSTGYDVRIQSVMKYDGPSPVVGFRPVVTYIGQMVEK